LVGRVIAEDVVGSGGCGSGLVAVALAVSLGVGGNRRRRWVESGYTLNRRTRKCGAMASVAFESHALGGMGWQQDSKQDNRDAIKIHTALSWEN